VQVRRKSDCLDGALTTDSPDGSTVAKE
jgi:hypothetical protein